MRSLAAFLLRAGTALLFLLGAPGAVPLLVVLTTDVPGDAPVERPAARRAPR